jgi:putative salt-induced outer membrane protein YdiY
MPFFARGALIDMRVSKRGPAGRAAFATLALLSAAPLARAQQVATPTATTATDDKAFKIDAPGLYANADLSYVLTSGNSSTSSLGFKGDVTRRWTRHSIGFAAGGIRTSSSSQDARFAVGTPDDFELRIPDAEPTAAAYYARGRYDYKLSERLFYTAGAGWERNRFSGIENRWVVDTGLGYIFLNNARTSFRGAAGITYTSEDFTVDDGGDGSFIGARVGWDFRHKLLETTTFTHSFIFDQSLEDGSDSRFDAQFGLHVAMSTKLGLKVNWRILYDNQPAFAEVPLFTPGGVPTGLSVLAPYKKTDQGLSVSLVFSVAPPKKG